MYLCFGPVTVEKNAVLTRSSEVRLSYNSDEPWHNNRT